MFRRPCLASSAAAALVVLTAGAAALAGEAIPPVPVRGAADPVVARLDGLVPGLMRAADVPGLSIALVRAGAVVWTRGYGVTNAATGKPVDDGTVYEGASLSKPLFAYGVLKLADAGRLDLDAPLDGYLASPYLDDPLGGRITARLVLTHTTGLANWQAGGGTPRLQFPPGARFSYSGEGFVYLQRVVERITGGTLDAYMREAVFGPLGMRSTSYEWRPDYAATKTYAHDLIGDVTGRRGPTDASAAGSVNTTAGDYARFVAAAMTGAGLSPSSAREMVRAQAAVDETCRECGAAPAGRPSRAIAWGLGWGLELGGGAPWFWHWGNNPGAKSFAIAGGPGRVGIVVLTNGENGMSVVPAILAASVGAGRPALEWLHVEPYDDPARLLLREIARHGAGAVARYRDGRRAHPLAEVEIETIGRMLLAKGMVAEAVELLEINAADFRRSVSAHNSLGAAYLRAGREASAADSYRRAQKLEPGDAESSNALERLAGGEPGSDR